MTRAITLGVIADTHLPDRTRRLHPEILPTFETARVAAILHAGDAIVPSVFETLEQVAPVLAVRGNRDSLRLFHLPLLRIEEFGGVRIGLTHGHKDLPTYLADQVRFALRGGLPFDFFIRRVVSMLPDVNVAVFGHIHLPVKQWLNGRLLFNPGSASHPISPNLPPSIGLLHIDSDGGFSGQIVHLSRFGL